MAGNGDWYGALGDGGPAVNASLDQPADVVVDGAGTTHIFWYESYYDGNLNMVGEDLYWYAKDLGQEWTDLSSLSGGEVGIDNALCLDGDGNPIFVYAAGEPGARGLRADGLDHSG